MIKTLKNSLHKTVGRKHLPYFEFITLLSDLQNSINSRPLTQSGKNTHNRQINYSVNFLQKINLLEKSEKSAEI